MDPARLRREFPELTEADLAAYIAVTRRILEAGADRARRTREILQAARQAQARARAGTPLGAEEKLLADYLDALGRMQARNSSGSE